MTNIEIPGRTYIALALVAATLFALPAQGQSQETKTSATVEYALDRIKIGNTANSLFNQAAGIHACIDCEESTRRLQFNQCTDKNNYLEKELSSMALAQSPLLSKLRNDKVNPYSIIKPSCVRMGMESRFGQNSNSFRTCSPRQEKASATRAVRPCISESYFKLVHNSFDLVSTCMMDFIDPKASEESKKLDVRAVYALINVESGFHLNAMSGTGAGGIGQFTAAAINDVNSNQLAPMQNFLKSNQNESCKALGEEILRSPMQASVGKSCERIAISKGNPAKNMLYTYAYLAGVKQQLDRSIFKNRQYEKAFSKLSPTELDKVRRALMVWSHNSGPAGTWTPAKALLQSKYRNSPIVNADSFIKDMQQAMSKFPASANNSQSRRKETATYFPTISSTLKDIETSVGGGSCVNM